MTNLSIKGYLQFRPILRKICLPININSNLVFICSFLVIHKDPITTPIFISAFFHNSVRGNWIKTTDPIPFKILFLLSHKKTTTTTTISHFHRNSSQTCENEIHYFGLSRVLLIFSFPFNHKTLKISEIIE